MPPSHPSKRITLDDLKKSTSATLHAKVVADVLELDPRTVFKGIKSGEIPSIKIGRRVLIPREAFLALFSTTGDA